MDKSDEQTSPPSLISKILIFKVLHKWIPTIVTLKKIPVQKEPKCKELC